MQINTNKQEEDLILKEMDPSGRGLLNLRPILEIDDIIAARRRGGVYSQYATNELSQEYQEKLKFILDTVKTTVLRSKIG